MSGEILSNFTIEKLVQCAAAPVRFARFFRANRWRGAE